MSYTHCQLPIYWSRNSGRKPSICISLSLQVTLTNAQVRQPLQELLHFEIEEKVKTLWVALLFTSLASTTKPRKTPQLNTRQRAPSTCQRRSHRLWIQTSRRHILLWCWLMPSFAVNLKWPDSRETWSQMPEKGTDAIERKMGYASLILFPTNCVLS